MAKGQHFAQLLQFILLLIIHLLFCASDSSLKLYYVRVINFCIIIIIFFILFIFLLLGM